MAVKKLTTAAELGGLLKKHGRLVAQEPYLNGSNEFVVLYGQTPECWFEYRLVMEYRIINPEAPALEQKTEKVFAQHRTLAKTWERHVDLIANSAPWYITLQWYPPEHFGIEIPLPAIFGKSGNNKITESKRKKLAVRQANEAARLRKKQEKEGGDTDA